MYECLTHVAKAVLRLSQSNIFPERGFSTILGKEKLSLEENTIVALRIVKDTIRLFGSEASVHLVYHNKRLSYSCKKDSLRVSVIFGRTATSESS